MLLYYFVKFYIRERKCHLTPYHMFHKNNKILSNMLNKCRYCNNCCSKCPPFAHKHAYKRRHHATMHSLLAACTQQQTDKLQRVLNWAIRVILGGSKYDHVTPLIRDDLHWPCVPERITFKLCLLVYKALHGLAPVYIKSMCVPVSLSTARSSLHSASRGHLIVPLGSSSASTPSHSLVQQLETVYLTLYEALNPLTLSKDYSPVVMSSGMLRRDISRRFIIILLSLVNNTIVNGRLYTR